MEPLPALGEQSAAYWYRVISLSFVIFSILIYRYIWLKHECSLLGFQFRTWTRNEWFLIENLYTHAYLDEDGTGLAAYALSPLDEIAPAVRMIRKSTFKFNKHLNAPSRKIIDEGHYWPINNYLISDSCRAVVSSRVIRDIVLPPFRKSRVTIQ